MPPERQTLVAAPLRLAGGGELVALLHQISVAIEAHRETPPTDAAPLGVTAHVVVVGGRPFDVVGSFDGIERLLSDGAHTIGLHALESGMRVRVCVGHLAALGPVAGGTLIVLAAAGEVRVRETVEEVARAANRPRVLAPLAASLVGPPIVRGRERY
jgi:hypothetical protein